LIVGHSTSVLLGKTAALYATDRIQPNHTTTCRQEFDAGLQNETIEEVCNAMEKIGYKIKTMMETIVASRDHGRPDRRADPRRLPGRAGERSGKATP
jgi:hypothetical protein